MSNDIAARRIFTLAEAQRLLPKVRALTEEGVREVDRLLRDTQPMSKDDPARVPVAIDLENVVAGWAEQMKALRLEVKGLWLVDFDNGQGYYCWRYPEESVQHYHGHGEGFAGRMKVM